MNLVRKYAPECVLIILVLANLFVWFAVYEKRPSEVMSVYFLDVGQGDAIFIDSPQHGRVLVDGGKNRQITAELGRLLPFGDKRIDVVIATHPDADHIGGLPEVVSRFDVGSFVESGKESDNSIDDELDRRLAEKNVLSLIARRGMTINFGDGAKLQILFPNQDVSKWDTNDASIIAKLVYGESSFLLTGDAGLKTENLLLKLDTTSLDVDVLKAGHHGSRTSSSKAFVTAVSPEYSIISAGLDNSYGHPHKEVIDTFQSLGAAILSTAESNTIIFQTNGKTLNIK